MLFHISLFVLRRVVSGWLSLSLSPFRDPDKPAETPPVRMPVVDVGGSQMDVISRLLKDRILLLGQQVSDLVAFVIWACCFAGGVRGAGEVLLPCKSMYFFH